MKKFNLECFGGFRVWGGRAGLGKELWIYGKIFDFRQRVSEYRFFFAALSVIVFSADALRDGGFVHHRPV